MDLKVSKSLMPAKKKMGTGKKALIIILSVAAVLLTAYTVFGYTMYSTRFVPGTVIDGIDCGNTDTAAVKAQLENIIADYKLDITDNVTDDTITADDISLKGDFDNELSNALNAQNKLAWGLGLFKSNEIKTEPVVSFDKEKLNTRVGELKLVSGKQVTDSVDAYLELDDSNRYKVVPEVYGTRLDRAAFDARVEQAVTELESKIDLSKEDFYIKPSVYKDNEAMLAARDNANKWLGSVITYNFGSKAEIVDASLTKDWIVIDKDYNTFFDRDKVKEFVRSLSRKYDTFGDTRNFNTSYGFAVSVTGGDYGYRMNREGEIDDLVGDVKSGEKKTRKPDYYQEGVSYDGPDIGNTYVEVDLTGQHLFLYKNGSMVLQTEMVSGNPHKGATPNGTYGITYCEKNATLRGDNYETEVAYWMPFNGDIGLHDATWQPKFGGDWYVNHGSHGCINLPLSMAAQIFSYAYKGMPVVCYRYDMTNYNKVEAYRKAAGLPSIFDVQPDNSAESATETTTKTATAA